MEGLALTLEVPQPEPALVVLDTVAITVKQVSSGFQLGLPPPARENKEHEHETQRAQGFMAGGLGAA